VRLSTKGHSIRQFIIDTVMPDPDLPKGQAASATKIRHSWLDQESPNIVSGHLCAKGGDIITWESLRSERFAYKKWAYQVRDDALFGQLQTHFLNSYVEFTLI